MMEITFDIGTNSNGENVTLLLNREPNLFISYSDTEQLYFTFTSFLTSLEKQHSEVKVAFALSHKTAERIIPDISSPLYSYKFIRDDYKDGYIESKHAFWSSLLKELRRRLQSTKDKKRTGRLQRHLLVVLIDDIFDMILSQQKKIGLMFLQLAVHGHTVGIHCIVASSGAYRNLLSQLIRLHPLVVKKLQEQANPAPLTIMNPLGGELILTPEAVKFYKAKDDVEFDRIFPEKDYPVMIE